LREIFPRNIFEGLVSLSEDIRSYTLGDAAKRKAEEGAFLIKYFVDDDGIAIAFSMVFSFVGESKSW